MAHLKTPLVSILRISKDIESLVHNLAHNFDYFALEAYFFPLWLVVCGLGGTLSALH